MISISTVYLSLSVHDMGENYWGAKRAQKSPGEFTLGSPIDARTNAFTMGATK